MVLFESAKASMGGAKVQQICEAMVQLFFFKTNVAACASLSLFEDFAPVQFVPDHCGDRHFLKLQVPNVDSKDLRNILTSYMSLFAWEMSMRGFRLSTARMSHTTPPFRYWLIEHL